MKEIVPITMKDIARDLGCSIATVSRALKNSPRISAAQKERIQAYARAHNFYPNVIGEALLDFYDEYNPKFVKGDKFRVIGGLLKGAEGYVVRIKKDHKLYVSIKGLCAVTTGYIPKAFLQKIE